MFEKFFFGTIVLILVVMGVAAFLMALVVTVSGETVIYMAVAGVCAFFLRMFALTLPRSLKVRIRI